MSEFWHISPRELNCAVNAYYRHEKAELLKSFYNALMSQSTKPEELYKVILDRMDNIEKEQSVEEQLNIALQYATLQDGVININFDLGLDTIPKFNSANYNYILKTKENKIKFLPPVSLDLVALYGDPEFKNGCIVLPENGIYEINIFNMSTLKINVMSKSYKIVIVKEVV